MNKTNWEDTNKDRDIVLYQPTEAINKPSKLIKAVYDNSLTTKQKLTYNYLLRELLNNKKSMLDTNEITFKLKDLQDFLGITKYVDFEKDLTKIQKTLIQIHEENSFTQATLLSSFTLPKKYNEETNNKVIVRFDTKLTKTLKSIDTYVTLPLQELQKLKNTHSITYFETFKRLLNKYEHKSSKNYSEVQLRELLNIGKEQYKIPRDFKNWCIDKPLEEINTHTSVSVSYERVKVSKGVYSYKFEFSQSIELTFNDFIQRFKKYCGDKDIMFFFKKRKLFYEEHNDKLLLSDFYIQENKDNQKNSYKNNETFNKDEAEEIHYKIYEYFIKNNIVFMNSLINNNSVNDTNSKLEDINENDMEIILVELDTYFSKNTNV